MTSKTLDKLFNSRIRVKILKFLFRNNPVEFGAYDLSRRIQEPFGSTRKELMFLAKVGLVNKKR